MSEVGRDASQITAEDLGYDRIFGKGTTPREVASYLAWAPTRRGADGRAS